MPDESNRGEGMTDIVYGTDGIRDQLRAQLAAWIQPTFRHDGDPDPHPDEAALVDRLLSNVILPYEIKLRTVEGENARMRDELRCHGVGEHYRLPHGGGLCVSCRRSMREGMLVVRATAPKCLLCTGEFVPEQPARDGGPGCLCPHTYRPDGTLVRDGVLAAGCPVHDADAKEDGDV